MHNPTDQKYTLGFIFDNKLTSVLLVHKQRPEWQKGKVNGVGGKYEPEETPQACIKRETAEETTLNIPESEWVYVGTIYQEVGNVGIMATKYSGNKDGAVSNDHEQIEWFDINNLPENVMGNLRWLIPLSLEKLHGTFETFSIHN